MNNKKSITYLLIIIFFLVICSATSIGYIIGNSIASKQNTPYSNSNENREINSEINDLKSVYNSKIAEKKANYKELEMEKDKVQDLLIELENTKRDAVSLLKYKEQYKNLEDKMRLLVSEIENLKGNKDRAVSNVVTARRIKKTKKIEITNLSDISKIETFVQIKTENVPEKKVEKVMPELKVTNLETVGFINKSSGNNKITVLANKTNFIRISFSVTGNSNASGVDKKYYIQVINSKNNVLGIKTTEYIDGKTLTYSSLKSVQFDGKNIQVEYDLAAVKFEKGNYFVCIYDRSDLVAKTQFNLD
jgi:hypothetical protein